MISHDVTEKTGYVAGIRVIDEEEDLLLITSDGQIIRMGVADIRVCGRASQGVILMRSASEVIDIASVSREDENEEEEPGEEAGTEQTEKEPEEEE